VGKQTVESRPRESNRQRTRLLPHTGHNGPISDIAMSHGTGFREIRHSLCNRQVLLARSPQTPAPFYSALISTGIPSYCRIPKALGSARHSSKKTVHYETYTRNAIAMLSAPKANPKNSSKPQKEPLVCFDVQWLAGQKETPDALPSRQEYRELKNRELKNREHKTVSSTSTKKTRASVNILASFLAIGLCCSVAYGLYSSGWLKTATQTPTTAGNPSGLTPEQQRQADETIDAILALQEMAAKADSNSPPTQKR